MEDPPTGLSEQLAALSIERQTSLLSGRDFWNTEPIDEADVPSMLLTDGPHGLRRQPDDVDHLGIGNSLPATCFPTASLLGATWDLDILEEVGAALGRECRAQGVGVLLGPGLNLKRHPAGGRNFEYLSEDPVLSGRTAAAIVRGVQREGVGACLKHFVANNHESYRMVSDSVVDERTLRELYLRGFEIAVDEGQPWAVMTGYNLVNGQYVSESSGLVNGILRDEWGFDGMVVTDWGGTNDRVASLIAGIDLEMPSSGGAHDVTIRKAVESGQLPADTLLRSANTVAFLARRVAEEAHDRGADPIDEVAHHRLARRVASAGMVLLTNDGTLPLDPDADVAVIGAFADQPRYQGAGSSQVTPTRLDTIRHHVEQRMTGSVHFAEGYDASTGEASSDQIRAAAELARRSAVAVVVVGLPAVSEAEGYDRDTLALPSGHDDLVTAVCAANPRTVVVLANGAPVLLPWANRPAAIVESYLGGQASGSAVVDVLVGDAEPGGRLAETFPASMVFPSDQNFSGRKRQVQYREGLFVGYRYFASADVAPQFPFGHGLSYTSFAWDPLIVSEARQADAGVAADGVAADGVGVDGVDGDGWLVEVQVTNTGRRAGSDVVQIYARFPSSRVHRPERQLVGFAKLHLNPGESATVEIRVPRRSIAVWNTSTAAWFVEPGTVELIAAASASDTQSATQLEVTGDDGPQPPVVGPGAGRFTASAAEFEDMLGRPIPGSVPVLPFTINTVVAELETTRLGRVAKAGLLKIARRESAKMLGPNPEPVLVKLSDRMLLEAPLRFLATMSGGDRPLEAFDGLTKMLSALRLTGRRNG